MAAVAATPEAGDYVWKAVGFAGGLLGLVGMGLAGWSYLGKMQAQRYLTVLYAYDDGALLMVLAAFGVICAMGGAYAVVMWQVVTTKQKMKRLQFVIYVYVVWGAALAVLCFVAYALVIACSNQLDQLFRTGFIDKLSHYRYNNEVRDTIDNMQRELGCCGSENISDWFTVDWSPNISFAANSIPESCCDTANLQNRGQRACVLAVPFGEAPRLSAFSGGCIPSATKYFGEILNTRSLLIMGCGIMQTVITLLVVYQVMKLKQVDKDKKKQEEVEGEKKKLIDGNDG